MNLTATENHQSEMRHAYYDGAPGIVVSGIVWIIAALVTFQLGMHNGVWTLLIGGMMIHPIGTVLDKILGRPAKTAKGNGLNPLVAASTIWLILGCAMAYGLYLLNPQFFFPVMMATIGCRYLVFASVFGKGIYWAFGLTLIVAANPLFFLAVEPALVAGICGLIELVFAWQVFSKAEK